MQSTKTPQRPTSHQHHSSTSTSSSAVVARTFTWFLDLPKELQIKIWSCAAGNLILGTPFSIPARVTFNTFHPVNDTYDALFRSEDEAVIIMRHALVHTCRLARQITLETWRREIEIVSCLETRLRGESRDVIESACVEWKVEVLREVNKLLWQMRASDVQRSAEVVKDVEQDRQEMQDDSTLIDDDEAYDGAKSEVGSWDGKSGSSSPLIRRPAQMGRVCVRDDVVCWVQNT